MAAGDLKENGQNGHVESAGHFRGFDHIHFWVGNAKQAASFYITRFGFLPVAYRGLETGERNVATHVVQQGKIMFAFSTALNPGNATFGDYLQQHGDGVRDVAFAVSDCRAVHEKALARGATSLRAPEELKDEHGSVVLATIQTYGDTVHTLVERRSYTGPFLPGFKALDGKDRLCTLLPIPGLHFIDHVVANQPDHEMEIICKWYEEKLEFKRFWCVDDSQIHTEYSSLRSIVMTDADETIKMPVNEPASGKRKSQIQEYVEYYGGPGVQHIALNTPDILHAVSYLKARGVDFISVPGSYYKDLRAKLANSPVHVKEDLDKLQELNILIDYDDNGYLLQIFTRPVEDRPTLFIEIIQRNNHTGFGVGNFKALFEAIEADQALRGNL